MLSTNWGRDVLEVVANALKCPRARMIQDGYYQNRAGVWGYYVTVWNAGHYHMISISDTESTPTLAAIAAALVSPTIHVDIDGRYRNSKGTLGYYATVKSGEHWYMVSVSDLMQPFHNQWWADRIG
jgi:hypothetical protein